VPIRASSAVAGRIMKPSGFDFVFIDADHTYRRLKGDIDLYSKLVAPGGVVCGHDCEGFVSDFDMDMLEKGRDMDFYEGVHCGAVLAVGESFGSYAINHGIWSVSRDETTDTWLPAKINTDGIGDDVQAVMPPMGCTSRYYCWRHKNLLYALPHTYADADIRTENMRANPDCLSAGTVAEMEMKLGESINDIPRLVGTYGEYEKYNLISFRNKIYALDVGIGAFDLITADDESIRQLVENRKCIITNCMRKAKGEIDTRNINFYESRINIPRLIGSFRNYNIIIFKKILYLVDQSIGPLDLKNADKDFINTLIDKGAIIVIDSDGDIGTRNASKERNRKPQINNWITLNAQRIADFIYHRVDNVTRKRNKKYEN
jgi:hypothetical protein